MQARINQNQLNQWSSSGDEAGTLFLNQLVRGFVEKIIPTTVEMEARLKTNDFLSVSKLAHQLKGTAGNLGLTLLHEYCLNVEHEAKSENATRTDSWIQKLKEEVPLTLNEFNEVRK